MNYNIKPFVVNSTDNLGLGSSTSYTAEAVSGTMFIQEKWIGSGVANAMLNVTIYEKVINEDLTERLERRESRNITSDTLTQAGLTADEQNSIFKTLAFGTDEEQFVVVSQLITVFGLELL